MADTDRLAQTIVVDDPDVFGTRATPSFGSRLIIRGRGRFRGSREQLVLGDTVLNRGESSHAATFHVQTGPRAIFSLFAAGLGPNALVQGLEQTSASLAWWKPNAQIHTQWPERIAWWNLIVPYERALGAAQAIGRSDLTGPIETVRVVRLSPVKQQGLSAAFQRALGISRSVSIPKVVDDLLLAVLKAAESCMDEHDVDEPFRLVGRQRRLRAVDGLVALADQADELTSLLLVCETIGVSLRTLNSCSNEFLGVSAAVYLRHRRLLRVFHELRAGNSTTVTQAATRYGFWDLGRFAALYREAFSETPSATLLRYRVDRSAKDEAQQ